MCIFTGSADRLPTIRPTLCSVRSEKASPDGGHSIPWSICAMTLTVSREPWRRPSPPPPRGSREPGGRKIARAPLGKIFPETLNVANPAARNMTHINSQHRWKLLSLDVARTRFTTLNNNFRNILKVFRNIERAPRPIDG
jgi:hypothetical protein